MEIDDAYSYASSVIVENLLYETNQGMDDFLNKKINQGFHKTFIKNLFLA